MGIGRFSVGRRKCTQFKSIEKSLSVKKIFRAESARLRESDSQELFSSVSAIK